jgi:hypothetical protein
MDPLSSFVFNSRIGEYVEACALCSDGSVNVYPTIGPAKRIKVIESGDNLSVHFFRKGIPDEKAYSAIQVRKEYFGMVVLDKITA